VTLVAAPHLSQRVRYTVQCTSAVPNRHGAINQSQKPRPSQLSTSSRPQQTPSSTTHASAASQTATCQRPCCAQGLQPAVHPAGSGTSPRHACAQTWKLGDMIWNRPVGLSVATQCPELGSRCTRCPSSVMRCSSSPLHLRRAGATQTGAAPVSGLRGLSEEAANQAVKTSRY
jgi:hypothetical protein